MYRCLGCVPGARSCGRCRDRPDTAVPATVLVGAAIGATLLSLPLAPWQRSTDASRSTLRDPACAAAPVQRSRRLRRLPAGSAVAAIAAGVAAAVERRMGAMRVGAATRCVLLPHHHARDALQLALVLLGGLQHAVARAVRFHTDGLELLIRHRRQHQRRHLLLVHQRDVAPQPNVVEKLRGSAPAQTHGSRVRRRNDRRRAVPTAASPNERVPPRRRVRMHRRGAALAAGHKAVCAAGQWAVRAAGRWVLPVAAWQVVHAAGRWAVRAASRTAVCAASQWAVRSAGRRALPVAAWQAVRAADAAFGCGRQCVQEAGPAAAGPGATCVCAATHQSLKLCVP
mmetsp:Transcript_40492/g.120788  ORF Transcript_40492/g.120788 Transcript_40492/m.120788 type:complete len:341 (-) Transcript_40492:3427-4449(-)